MDKEMSLQAVNMTLKWGPLMGQRIEVVAGFFDGFGWGRISAAEWNLGGILPCEGRLHVALTSPASASTQHEIDFSFGEEGQDLFQTSPGVRVTFYDGWTGLPHALPFGHGIGFFKNGLKMAEEAGRIENELWTRAQEEF